MAYDPKNPRIRKAKYTAQDVRQQALEARDELLANVEFIMEAIREDRIRLQKYKALFGDLKYRPIVRPSNPEHSIEPVYGPATDTNIEPLASAYRATINSLLQSIRLIQSEILPEDDAEGDSAGGARGEPEESTPKRSLRDAFQTNVQTGKAIEPTVEEEPEEEAIPTPKLVETKKSTAISSIKATAESKPSSEPNPNPKPWRTQAQTTIVKTPETKPIVEKPKENILQNPNKLDPETERLRNELMGLKGSGSKMSGLMSKYSKKSGSEEEE